MSYNPYITNLTWNQRGGGKCSLCKAPGTNKSTCPLNPKAKNPDTKNHPAATEELLKSLPKIPSHLPPASETNDGTGVYCANMGGWSNFGSDMIRHKYVQQDLGDLWVVRDMNLTTGKITGKPKLVRKDKFWYNSPCYYKDGPPYPSIAVNAPGEGPCPCMQALATNGSNVFQRLPDTTTKNGDTPVYYVQQEDGTVSPIYV